MGGNLRRLALGAVAPAIVLGFWLGGVLSPGVATPAATPQECTGSDVSLSPATFMAGTFHYLTVYAVTNTSESACTLSGYPTVTAVQASGEAFAIQTKETTESPMYQDLPMSDVVLQPGLAGGFYVAQIGDPSATPCAPADHVTVTTQVALPGGGPTLVSPVSGNVCPNDDPTVYVSPFLSTTSPPAILGDPSATTTSGAAGT